MATNLCTSTYIPNLPDWSQTQKKRIKRRERWEKEIITLDIVFIGKKEELGEIRFQIHP